MAYNMETLQKEQLYYTYADYCEWKDGERWEIIDGSAVAMAPAPAWGHQRFSSRLQGQLFNYLQGKSCEVFTAPFDVRLNADTLDDTVVQPDLVVICDRSKLSGTGCVGAPDMVIEILSQSKARFDRTVKFDVYRRAGVREYWIVDPDTKTLSVHILKNGEYMTRAYTDADTVTVHVLEGCMISLSDVFEE